MKMHLSHSSGDGALDGQHGISLAGMSLAAVFTAAAIDISSVIAGIDTSDVIPAITGRDNGANASPAIMKIASRRRMVSWRFTPAKSHRTVRIDSPAKLTTL